MNKRIPFIALLIAMEWGLGPITLGTIDVFTSMAALLTLRWKDFLIYSLATTPSAIISYMNYGGFWATSAMVAPTGILYFVFLAIVNEYVILGVTIGIWGYSFFLIYRTLFVIKQVNKIRHHFHLREKLYPEIKFKQRIRKPKRDFGDRFELIFKVLSVIGLAALAGLFTMMDTAVVLRHNELTNNVFNCWQVENNATRMFPNYTSTDLNILKQVLRC